MVPSPLQPTVIGLPGHSESATGLRPGQVIHTNLQMVNNELVMMLGPNRVTVPPSANLQPGQWVHVEVHRTPNGLQLRVVPEGRAGQAPPATDPGAAGRPAAPSAPAAATYTPSEVPSGPPGPAVPQAPTQQAPVPGTPTTGQGQQAPTAQESATVRPQAPAAPAQAPAQSIAGPQAQTLFQLLAGLAGQTRTALGAEGLQPLVPPALAQHPKLVEQLFTLWRPTAQAPQQDLATIATLVRQAVQQNALPESLAAAASQWLAPVSAQEPVPLAAFLGLQGKALPWEARLALLLTGGRKDSPDFANAFREDGRSLAQALRNAPAFLAFLREQGREQAFNRAVESLQERLAAGQLQNLRTNEAPYLFLEVPLPQEEGFQRVMVHFFSDGERSGRRFSGQDGALVALDLSLSALGDLWISIHADANRCKCRIQAGEPATLDLFRAHTDELARRLEAAQDRQVHIEVLPWDGDRLRETARLMTRFQGLDLSG